MVSVSLLFAQIVSVGSFWEGCKTSEPYLQRNARDSLANLSPTTDMLMEVKPCQILMRWSDLVVNLRRSVLFHAYSHHDRLSPRIPVPAEPEIAWPTYPLLLMPTLPPVWNSFCVDWMQAAPPVGLLHPPSMPQTAARSWPGMTCTSDSVPAEARGGNAKVHYARMAPGVQLEVDWINTSTPGRMETLKIRPQTVQDTKYETG